MDAFVSLVGTTSGGGGGVLLHLISHALCTVGLYFPGVKCSALTACVARVFSRRPSMIAATLILELFFPSCLDFPN